MGIERGSPNLTPRRGIIRAPELPQGGVIGVVWPELPSLKEVGDTSPRQFLYEGTLAQQNETALAFVGRPIVKAHLVKVLDLTSYFVKPAHHAVVPSADEKFRPRLKLARGLRDVGQDESLDAAAELMKALNMIRVL